MPKLDANVAGCAVAEGVAHRLTRDLWRMHPLERLRCMAIASFKAWVERNVRMPCIASTNAATACEKVCVRSASVSRPPMKLRTSWIVSLSAARVWSSRAAAARLIGPELDANAGETHAGGVARLDYAIVQVTAEPGAFLEIFAI